MLTVLKDFMKKPTTLIGIGAALMFQVIFSLVWMTGYDGVTDNTHKLKIEIVNEDNGIGKQVESNLKANLPFELSSSSSLDEAKEHLDDRDVQMVLYIPADFSNQLQAPGKKGQLQYWINESNPALIKSIMQSVASGVTATVNKEAVTAGAEAVLTQMKMPAAQAQGAAQGLAEKVVSDFHYSHPVDGMANQMVPMMLVLASYVGSMLMALNLQASSAQIHTASRWEKLIARIVIHVVSAVVIALVGSSLAMLLGGQNANGFLALWGFQTLFLMSFMFFAQMFVLLFGNAGMLFNILALSAQLVSSGAMVPRELLPDFYFQLGRLLPATSAVEGTMNLLFGGPSASGPALTLVVSMAVTLAVGVAATALRRKKAPVTMPADQPTV
ncbi:YhgE/Pip domain-containing protein [Paenibacillus caui]|uniref:YhgE/Pip domain-containing protein n=1 Tax=Paenibacillus caui TaxID=2873927 RepID=UPI001CA98BAD|nr:ABC transporter permease [Paenibacillus caui]